MSEPNEMVGIVRDSVERLERAVVHLEHIRGDQGSYSSERFRLDGKIEGVKLALSYLREIERVTPTEGAKR